MRRAHSLNTSASASRHLTEAMIISSQCSISSASVDRSYAPFQYRLESLRRKCRQNAAKNSARMPARPILPHAACAVETRTERWYPIYTSDINRRSLERAGASSRLALEPPDRTVVPGREAIPSNPAWLFFGGFPIHRARPVSLSVHPALKPVAAPLPKKRRASR